MRVAAGIDLGGTKIQGVVVDDGGEVVGQARGKTPVKGGPDAAPIRKGRVAGRRSVPRVLRD